MARDISDFTKIVGMRFVGRQTTERSFETNPDKVEHFSVDVAAFDSEDYSLLLHISYPRGYSYIGVGQIASPKIRFLATYVCVSPILGPKLTQYEGTMTQIERAGFSCEGTYQDFEIRESGIWVMRTRE